MKVVIIGGGAAGMMAAATIIEGSAGTIEVILIEKNAVLGRKVSISGGGRCNVTTGIEDMRLLLTKYPRGSKFLTSAMHRFSPIMVREWFENHEIPLKKEKDLRIFPVSDVGTDIVDMFERLFRGRVDVRLKQSVTGVRREENGIYHIDTTSGPIEADCVVLAMGGQAYRHTGSTGDGYAFAEKLGHSITKLAPSLNAFIVAEKFMAELAGVSFERVELHAQAEGKTTRAEGGMVCTHTGFSGPAVFALSSQVAFEKYSKERPLDITINFLPDRNQEFVLRAIDAYATLNPKQHLKQALRQWLPLSYIEVVSPHMGIDPESVLAQTSKAMRMSAAALITHCTFHAVGRAAGEEFVTAGGIETKEVDPKTMQSKISSGLYFAGEILNVDGFTGGFNLQASWAMGHAAGEAIVAQQHQEHLKEM